MWELFLPHSRSSESGSGSLSDIDRNLLAETGIGNLTCEYVDEILISTRLPQNPTGPGPNPDPTRAGLGFGSNYSTQ